MKFLISERQLKTIVNFLNEEIDSKTIIKAIEKLNDIVKSNNTIDDKSDSNKKKTLNTFFRILTDDQTIEPNDVIDDDIITKIKKYQKENGLEETGNYDDKTNDNILKGIITKFGLDKIKTTKPEETKTDSETTNVGGGGKIGDQKEFADFAAVTNRVIDKFEGGYWNGPTKENLEQNKSGVCNDHPAKGMGRSTETLFGLDRYHGRIEKTDAGKDFFAEIDRQKNELGMDKFCKKWKHYYRGGELEQKLKDLAIKIMEERYEKNMKNYVNDSETKKIIESDPGLLLHMSYATWNGSGYFKRFAQNLKKAVKEGKRGKELIDIAVKDRYDTPFNHPDRHEAEIRRISNA
jgi:hypothetical protein